MMMYKQIEIVDCADEDRFKRSLLVVTRATGAGIKLS